MVVNLKAHGISRGTRKLVRTLTLIKQKKKFVPLSIGRPLKELEHVPIGLERYNLSKYSSILFKKNLEII